ncbi:MAG: MFS transporter [Ignavibacteriaceae bacterium]|nr:MFS transporter [Ignavibacteriaceae bacterium]
MIEIQKKLTKSFYVLLSLPATAMGFALSIQISALSWILGTKYNLNLEEIGFVWAAGPLAGIFGQVIVGLISDKVWFWGGRRRPFIFIGGPLAALMLIALPHIDTISGFLGVSNLIIVALIIALTLDLSINISFNPTRSIIADVTPEGITRTKGYTWMQTISGFFGVLAYIIGATLGNYTLIYSGSLIVLLFSIIPMFFIEEPRVLVSDQKTEVSGTLSESTDWRQLMVLFVAHGFSWIGVQTMFVFIIAFIQQNLNPQNNFETGQFISISFAVLNTIGFIVPVFLLEPVSEKIGRIKVHIISVLIMALGYFVIAYIVNSSLMLYFAMVIVGIGWGAIVSLPFAIMSEKVDKTRMGFFMGIFNLSVVIPQLIVSLLIGGFIQDMTDKSNIFLISGISLALSGILWFFVKEKKITN